MTFIILKNQVQYVKLKIKKVRRIVMNGLVSVIVPVYNRELYIQDCINSVLKQSYGNFEMIIVDDGSSDSSAEICKKDCENDSRIKFYNQNHKGASAARNLGLDNCLGDYVFFLDSDDVIHPNLLENLVYGIEAENTAISASSTILIPQNTFDKCVENDILQNITPSTFTRKSNVEALHSMFTSSCPLSLIGGVMMRRDLIGDTRFNTDLFIGEDYLFIYENLIKGKDVTFLNKPEYYQRYHTETISFQKDFSAFYSRFIRRVLVWKSEEEKGRMQNAKIQKRDAFSCYTTCLKTQKPYSEDAKKMRKEIKTYKSEIFKAFTLKGKLLFILAYYLPYTFLKVSKLKKQ